MYPALCLCCNVVSLSLSQSIFPSLFLFLCVCVFVCPFAAAKNSKVEKFVAQLS